MTALMLLCGESDNKWMLDKSETLLKDEHGRIKIAADFKELVKSFRAFCVTGRNVIVPEAFLDTIDVFLLTWDARYTYPNEMNLPSTIHAHVFSEWYKTRLLSGTDGYYIGCHGDRDLDKHVHKGTDDLPPPPLLPPSAGAFPHGTATGSEWPPSRSIPVPKPCSFDEQDIWYKGRARVLLHGSASPKLWKNHVFSPPSIEAIREKPFV